jgi:hypothetical protein
MVSPPRSTASASLATPGLAELEAAIAAWCPEVLRMADEVDASLIDWMRSLTPDQRLGTVRGAAVLLEAGDAWRASQGR